MSTPPAYRQILGLLPPFLAGALLRLWHLPAQILLDDELHAIADDCIPLTAGLRAWTDLGFPLTEWSLRLPSLLCGLAIPVVLPWLLRRDVRWQSCRLWAWLLALSPTLAYYGRNSRPYAVATLLAAVAALSLWRWWRSGRWSWGVAYGFAGAAASWFLPVVLPFVAAGLLLLARERPALAASTAALVAGQWLAICVLLRPLAIRHPIVLDRYLLVTLPFALAWVARGLDALASFASARWGGIAGRAVGPAFLLVLLLAGPYAADPDLRLGSFAGSNAAIHFTDRTPPALPPSAVPEIFRWIRRQPGDGEVLHAPAATNWARTRGELALSRVHGRKVILGVAEERLSDPRLALRTVVPAEPSALLASGAEYLLVDREPLRFILPAMGRAPGARPVRDPVLSAAAAELALRLEAAWGEPDLEEGSLSLWSLERVRRSSLAGP